MVDQKLIVVKQLPIIEEQLRIVAAEIDKRTSEALSMECTEDTVKTVKSLRADLNKDFQDFEKRRVIVKAAIMEPYNAFEEVYKECVAGKYKEADKVLKSRVDSVENELKEKKATELRRYFAEYAQKWSIDFVTFEQVGLNITLSTSLKSLKEQVQEFISRICDDINLIETQEHKDEVMVEYRKSLNCSQAITAVVERHKALEAEAARKTEQEQKVQAQQAAVAKVDEVVHLSPPMASTPPINDTDPIKTLPFRVTAPISKLRVLKQFLIDGGYEYE